MATLPEAICGGADSCLNAASALLKAAKGSAAGGDGRTGAGSLSPSPTKDVVGNNGAGIVTCRMTGGVTDCCCRLMSARATMVTSDEGAAGVDD